MYIVAGSNLFGQWFSKQVIFEEFVHVNNHDKFDLSKGKLICIAWSYNIFQIDNIYIVSGSWNGKDNQTVLLPLPEDCTENSKLLISCNDYNIVVFNIILGTIWILDLKTECYKKVALNEIPNKEIEHTNVAIIKVVATNDLCLYLTDLGYVYNGILPTYINTSHISGKVCDIQCGYEHYMVLTDSGTVYTWGNGRRLQLGHGDIINLETPTEVEALSGVKIVKIRASGWHSMALSEFGDLYVWGWNDTGQLGIKTKFKNNTNEQVQADFGIPTLLNIYDEDENEVEANIKDFACGTRHSVILLADNSIWTSGDNKYGQLGFPIEKYQKLDYFKKSYVTEHNSTIICGPWCTIIQS